MTTTLVAPASAPQRRGTATAVLTVSGMPTRLRLRVEGLMNEHLSDGNMASPLVDIWDVAWFTRWHRDPVQAGAVCCREVIDAPRGELVTLASALGELADTFLFHASVSIAG